MNVDVRHLIIEVTERCNNNCAHCYNFWRGSGQERRDLRPLPRADIRSLVAKVLLEAPVEQVALSGGEPLLRPDLPDIASDIADMGLRVVVITNGSLLDLQRLRRFPRGCVFEVTLFSSDPGIHDSMAGRRRYETLIRNLAVLSGTGLSFVIAAVITSKNAHDVARTIQLAIALGAQAVLLNRVNLGRRMYIHSPELVPSAVQIQSALSEADAAARKYGITILVSVPIPPCVANPGDYPNLHFGWCPRGGVDAYYAIDATGKVRPCNHSSFILGDLRKSSFGEIVGGRNTRSFWRPVPPECQACKLPMKELCRGGCPAASDECFGDRLHMDPFVQLSRSRRDERISLRLKHFETGQTGFNPISPSVQHSRLVISPDLL